MCGYAHNRKFNILTTQSPWLHEDGWVSQPFEHLNTRKGHTTNTVLVNHI